MEEMTLYGVVAAIIYKNEENGYTVFKFSTESDGEIIAHGNILEIAAGEHLEIFGTWKTHKNYGMQFQIEYCSRTLPDNTTDIISYLGSGVIRGIGLKLSEKIVDKFGIDTFNIIAKDYKRLTEIRGITDKKAEDISKSFNKLTVIISLSEFLSQYSINNEIIPIIFKEYGENSLEIVLTNIYVLLDCGIEFGICDFIAKNLGKSSNDISRLKAGILYTMKHNLQNGHSFLPKNKLINATMELLECEEDILNSCLEELSTTGKIIEEHICSLDVIFLKKIYDAENYICNKLLICAETIYEYDFDISLLIDEIQNDLGIKFAELQQKAIEMASKYGVTVLTGGPGTGKTTTIKGIISLFEMLGLNTVLAAPTGRAAKRMTELCGYDSKTLHRLLEAVKVSGNDNIFMKNEDNQIDADVIILDEVSMIDINLMTAFLKAVNSNTRIILVGDYDQLPPVGPGNLLRDILQSNKIKTTELGEIFRQEKESFIISNAHKINRGEIPIASGNNGDFFIINKSGNENIITTVVDLCKNRLPSFYKLNPSQIQILTPSKKTGVGTNILNTFLQESLNPSDNNKEEKQFGKQIFRMGDKVMQICNNYDIEFEEDDKTGVFNGDIGIILEINHHTQTMRINFDDRVALYSYDNLNELELAYAMTVHKSQGSEFDAVIFVASNNTSKKLLTRNILYTGITRAKRLIVIVSTNNTIEIMVNNNTKQKRYSALRARLAK